MTDLELIEQAWGIIANAGGGNWELETKEWQTAADQWRDRYHERLAQEFVTDDERPDAPTRASWPPAGAKLAGG